MCNPGGAAKSGPPLWGIFGREAGTGEFGAYSDANKNSGITWSDKHMFQFLVNPKKYMVAHSGRQADTLKAAS